MTEQVTVMDGPLEGGEKGGLKVSFRAKDLHRFT